MSNHLLVDTDKVENVIEAFHIESEVVGEVVVSHPYFNELLKALAYTLVQGNRCVVVQYFLFAEGLDHFCLLLDR